MSSKSSLRFPQRTVLLALALSVGLVPAALAYNIHLKNGSVIDARSKYQVRDGKAVITLRNGTVSTLSMAEIDVQKTETANKVNYGSATVINAPSNENTPPPPPPPQRGLGQLINQRRAAQPPAAPPSRNPREAPPAAAPTGRGAKTAAGHVDLNQLARKPYPDLDLASSVQELFRAGGAGPLKVQAGTRGDRVFVEVSTNSEGSVFQALETSAQVLLALGDRYPGKVAAFEILMMTPAGERAGQFVLTPDLAGQLASKKVETSVFFVNHVQF